MMNRFSEVQQIGASLLALAVCISCPAVGRAATEQPLADGIDGVLSLTPVGTASYIAVDVTAGPAFSIIGLRWFHNDGTSAFPRVLVVGASDSGQPNLADVRAEASGVAGPNLGWAEMTFAAPVAATGAPLFAVFELPAYEEHTGDGLGGGSGIGYRQATGGRAAYLSRDGEEWVPLSSRTALAVEAKIVGGTATLSKGAQATAEGPLAPQQEFATTLDGVAYAAAPGAARIRYSMARTGVVSLEVYNIRGQRVRALLGESVAAGAHVLEWSGTDERGAPVASGAYIVRMKALGQVFHRKLTIVR